MALKSAVDIEIVMRGGRNLSVKAYCTPPFKVMDITESSREGLLRFMLMSSSPGVLDGDEYDINITLGERCSFELQTQSYQRLFTMKTGARQRMTVHLEPGAGFKFLPHPVVPHAASDFVAHNKIFLSEGCSLIWGEVFTCGRKLNGEQFAFTRFQNLTEIYLGTRLLIKENLIMEPGIISAAGMGQLEGFTHQATLIIIDPLIVPKEVTAIACSLLDLQPNIIYGITSASINGIVIRILGSRAEQLFECLKELSLQISQPVSLHPNQ